MRVGLSVEGPRVLELVTAFQRPEVLIEERLDLSRCIPIDDRPMYEPVDARDGPDDDRGRDEEWSPRRERPLVRVPTPREPGHAFLSSPLIGSPLWQRARIVLLAALGLVIVGAGLWWIQGTGFLTSPSPSAAPTTRSSSTTAPTAVPLTTPAIGTSPIDFVLPQTCVFVGDPEVGSERTVWRYDCGQERNRDARAALRDALVNQGWTACGPALANETWLKGGLALTVSESSGSPGDYPRFSQRYASSC